MQALIEGIPVFLKPDPEFLLVNLSE